MFLERSWNHEIISNEVGNKHTHNKYEMDEIDEYTPVHKLIYSSINPLYSWGFSGLQIKRHKSSQREI